MTEQIQYAAECPACHEELTTDPASTDPVVCACFNLMLTAAGHPMTRTNTTDDNRRFEPNIPVFATDTVNTTNAVAASTGSDNAIQTGGTPAKRSAHSDPS